MKILLIGEYSNVHWTLAEGLRVRGHKVTVVSNGDFWKNYPRDISLTRSTSRLGGISFVAKLLTVLPRLRGYDIVQLINPMFLELKAERITPIYDYLRRHNKKIVLCAFGMDYYWVSTCCEKKQLRYSDFNIGDKLRDNKDAIAERRDWIGTAKERLNRHIAADCDAIVAGLYEYWTCYHPIFKDKTAFISFPIKLGENLSSKNTTIIQESNSIGTDRPIKLFIGINSTRSEYKGTDIMLAAAEDVIKEHPGKITLKKAVSIPFDQYRRMMDSSDAILDQLYSYTPAMNSLLAMSKGIVCIGGGEPENYDILGEQELRPIINVEPTYDSVRQALENLVDNPGKLARLKTESIEYVRRHHDYLKVACQYEKLYRKLLSQ